MSAPFLIPASIAASFPEPVQVKGRLLHAARCVSIDEDSVDLVTADVIDKRRTHAVDITLDQDLATGSCTCAHFSAQGPCRHLWAVLIEAARRGRLHLRGRPVVRFRDGFSLETEEVDLDLDSPEMQALVDEMERSLGVVKRVRLNWSDALAIPRHDSLRRFSSEPTGPSPGTKLAWSVDIEASNDLEALILEAKAEGVNAAGKPATPKRLRISRLGIADLADEEDRLVLGSLVGAMSGSNISVGYSESAEVETSWRITSDAQRFLVKRLALAGRLRVSRGRLGSLGAAEWQDEPPWKVVLEATRKGEDLVVESSLRRGERCVPASEVLLAVPGHAILEGPILASIEPAQSTRWLAIEREHGPMHVHPREEATAIAAMLAREDIPDLLLPPDLGWRVAALTPTKAFDMSPSERPRFLSGILTFDYDGVVLADEGHVSHSRPCRLVAPAERRVIVRDVRVESAARAALGRLGMVQRPGADAAEGWQVPLRRMAAVATALVKEGWRVTARGKMYRPPGTPRLSVASGIDWFEVKGDVSYGDFVVPLPEILRAARRGVDAVVLDDGTLGMLPDEWLKRHGRLLSMAESEDDHLRFKPTQAMLLDLLLEQQPEADCDATFARVRKKLREFDGIKPARQPRGFQGTLRDYQLEGLAWLEFLRDLSFGGCLADDMGVGKTAQVLALLESRRTARAKEPRRPSLVVVPRSLIFNWMEEARHFTPRLRVTDLSRGDRDLAALKGADVGLITYGTLRRDAEHLKDVELDYAILDEAQAIKNPASASAKAARLLKARHRLVMTGTPVENHLGELWSLFEFLNPGMLGASSAFRGSGKDLELSDETRETLSRALRPFLLRRTKAQVAKELPVRSEQTLHCEMSATQARHYRAVADRYRAEILKLVDEEGVAKTRMNVLEALLRLRQVACHPALVDRKRIGEKSGKLTTLLETLGQVIEEGHKALVFSQFTSFLEIVRAELDARGIVHEDLDGSTRDRQAPVDRFQSDPSCRVFLISLKAGGVGLNLTAADYVFLLDPWWNPAVEAQAIDRTHRIGQSKPVMAYRLVSTGTVEERVLELQSRKRALADALLGEDASLLGKLSREDIELLLS